MIVFAFGNGFSGTKTLNKLLNLTKLNSGHERQAEESPKRLYDCYQQVYEGLADPVDVLTKQRVPLVRRIKDFCEVSWVLSYYINGLYRLWPDARFIHIFRNPKTHIFSTYNRGVFTYHERLLKMSKWWPKPRVQDNIPWDEMPRIEKCAWWWSDLNEFILQQLKQVPEDQVFTVKFEQLIEGERIGDLFSFLNLEVPPKNKINEVLRKQFGKTNYSKMAENRGFNSILSWEDLSMEEQERCKMRFENTLIKLEARI